MNGGNMNRARLNTLANALDVHPAPAQFDLNDWFADQTDGEWLPPITPDNDPIYCGYAACAVGYACTLPELRAEGLTFTTAGGEPNEPVYKDATGWQAVRDFFDLDAIPADRLFDVNSYSYGATPQDVAKRIRAYIA